MKKSLYWICRVLPLVLGVPVSLEAAPRQTLSSSMTHPGAMLVPEKKVALDVGFQSWENLPDESQVKLRVAFHQGGWGLASRVEQVQLEDETFWSWDLGVRRLWGRALYEVSSQRQQGLGVSQQAFALRVEQPFWESGDFDASLELFPSEPKLAPKSSFGVTLHEGRFASRLGVPKNSLDVVLSLGLVIGPQAEVAVMQKGEQSSLVLKMKPAALGFRITYRNHAVLGSAVETRLVWGER